MSSIALPRDKRAQSTVVATVFFLAIVMVVFFGAYMSTSRTIVAMTKYDQEVLNERIAIPRVKVEETGVNVIVLNEGNEVAHLIALWFNSETAHQRVELEGGVFLTPKNFTTIVAPPAFGEFDTVKVITERGNVAEALIPYPTVGIGEFPLISMGDITVTGETVNFNATNLWYENVTINYVSVEIIPYYVTIHNITTNVTITTETETIDDVTVVTNVTAEVEQANVTVPSKAIGIYTANQTLSPAEHLEISISLASPTYGDDLEELILEMVEMEVLPEVAIIELYSDVEGDWQLIGKAAVTITLE